MPQGCVRVAKFLLRPVGVVLGAFLFACIGGILVVFAWTSIRFGLSELLALLQDLPGGEIHIDSSDSFGGCTMGPPVWLIAAVMIGGAVLRASKRQGVMRFAVASLGAAIGLAAVAVGLLFVAPVNVLAGVLVGSCTGAMVGLATGSKRIGVVLFLVVLFAALGVGAELWLAYWGSVIVSAIAGAVAGALDPLGMLVRFIEASAE